MFILMLLLFFCVPATQHPRTMKCPEKITSTLVVPIQRGWRPMLRWLQPKPSVTRRGTVSPRSKPTPLATENLLENTDGMHPPSVLSRRQPATSIYAESLTARVICISISWHSAVVRKHLLPMLTGNASHPSVFCAHALPTTSYTMIVALGTRHRTDQGEPKSTTSSFRRHAYRHSRETEGTRSGHPLCSSLLLSISADARSTAVTPSCSKACLLCGSR